MNSFGTKFRVSIFGESHGEALGVVLDGIPAGMELSASDFDVDLSRRKSGAKGTTTRKESDTPHIVSGLFEGHTTGAPMTILFYNENTISSDYSALKTHPRPSHSDFVAQVKHHGMNDYRGGGHFSGRLTAALVAAGVVAKRVLKGVDISAQIIEIASLTNPAQWQEAINKAMSESDSVGGIIECRIKGLPIGLGEPFFDSAESIISHMIFSVPAVKGIEFGNGFQAARLRGSENNDPIINIDGTTATNNSGGINGGITNGNDIVFRVAVKPTASIAREQQTLNLTTGRIDTLRVKGRHDACITLRASVVIEAAAAIALCQFDLFEK